MDSAFAELRLCRIYAETRADSEPSWRLMERPGMKREAGLREVVHEDDYWWYVVVYTVLADEWPAR
jgi:RimJ/RimL family protein N-acetyltransferase